MNMMNETASKIAEKLKGIGEISFEMIKKRAIEIAKINERPMSEPNDSDWLQAEKELTGKSEETISNDQKLSSDQGDITLENSDQDTQAPEVRPEDEISPTEKLVNEGIEEAEHDTLLKGHQNELP
jgi:hypothetical protein